MSGKRISELTEATKVNDSDVFVMEQSGVAKKVTAAILKVIFGGGGGSAGNGIPSGGETGQMLVKVSDADYDADWQYAPSVGVVSNADLSDWASGSFTMTVDGEELPGSVTFDSNNNPKSVTFNGHTMTITLPA